MSKRVFVLIVGLLIIAATAGCFDMFAIPGVAVSPDGSQIYFLSGGGLTSSDGAISSLSSISINGGDVTNITVADKENLTSAFAVNPTNGDVAYIQTGKANGGTQLMIYSGGSSRELIAPSAFDGIGVGTMMRYSPDGSKIALAMTKFPPSVTIDTLNSENSSDFDPSQLAGTQFVVYLINVADGSMTTVSNPTAEAANTVAWSPDSKLLAYNAWIDGNGDGKITTMPDFSSLASGGGTGAADTSQIRIYDTSSGATTPINSTSIDYAEAFISNTEVAYVSLNLSSLMGASAGASSAPTGASVMAYDVSSGASRVAYTGQGGNLVIGMELSPDGSQIAWVELPDSQTSMMGGSSGSSPSHLYVGANFDASAGPIAEIPGDTGFPDAPVWTPDGKSILVSSTNIFSTLIGQMSASFGASSSSSDGATPTEAIPTQKLLKVDVASKEVTTVYEGPMSNSSFFASVIGLATSGMMDQLGAMGGSQ